LRYGSLGTGVICLDAVRYFSVDAAVEHVGTKGWVGLVRCPRHSSCYECLSASCVRVIQLDSDQSSGTGTDLIIYVVLLQNTVTYRRDNIFFGYPRFRSGPSEVRKLT
jgi:hypothetical protein